MEDLGMIDTEKMIAMGVPCSVIKINPDGTWGEEQSFNMENFKIQDWQAEAIARAILPDIIAFYESEEGKTEWAKYLAEREAKGLPPLEATCQSRPRRRKRK